MQGRDLRYAIVGHPDRVKPKGLAEIRAAAAKLTDPRTSRARAAQIARGDPAILWIAGNVHGGEESGTDASLRVLWELADREDCAARQILDQAIVVILPTQNPDGRELDTRRNAYGFDMNRDWFARTQPETDGKLEMLRRYPPVVFIDAHEMGNEDGYFFPPNADPVYHEISSEAVGWINGLYGPAMQREFGERGIPYFNYDIYDLFYMGYGDTVPATGFGAAGMTFEKTSGHPAARRVFEQYLTQWTTLSEAAGHKRSILTAWHKSYADAQAQGEAGLLEPNAVYAPGSTVLQPVPDLKVRRYFLRADDPAKEREVRALVRRLQRMDVRVDRLTRSLTVPDFTPYGRAARPERLPAGTYVVEMAQRQKRWVQAMLNEDTYVPFPYFYDVTAWSQPLLFDVQGGYSGKTLPQLRSAPVGALRDPGPPRPPRRAPEIALYSMSPDFVRGIESSGWLRWLLDEWELDYREVDAEGIRSGALAGADVLLVPDGYATLDLEYPEDPYGLGDLGDEGAAEIRAWVRGGGRYVGWLDGAVLAAGVGVSSATFESAEELGIVSPGALIRTVGSPRGVGAGMGRYASAFWDSRYVMRAGAARTAVRFPAAGSEDFYVSGYVEGAEALGGSAAVVDEAIGRGRTVAFGFEPNFRGFTDGTQRMLRNAMFGDGRGHGGRHDPWRKLTRARNAARTLAAPRSAVTLAVPERAASDAERLLRAGGRRFSAIRGGGNVTYAIRGPRRASGDEHPWARALELELRRAELPVLMYRVP